MNDKKLQYGFNTLYSQYYRKSFLFTKSYVHDPFVAEDIVSESIIKLWESLKEHAPEDIKHLEALLLTILKNRSLDYLKHEALRYEVEEEITSSFKRELEIRISSLQDCNPNEIFSEEIKQILYNTLNSMPEQTKRIFILSRLYNKTNKEIATELCVTIKDIEYHITKALKNLRINLKDYLPFFLFLLS
ncbi:MAG: RNA polymerase sigma-70 factor [Parabacteroides sp.]